MSLAVDFRRLGGPSGRHARQAGLLYDPAPWLILTTLLVWVVRMGHQAQCEQAKVGEPVKTMLRMCYSDVPVMWSSNQWGAGTAILSDATAIPQTPVNSFIAELSRLLTSLSQPLGGDAQQQLLAGNVFMRMQSVVLFCFLLAWVMAHMLMGRESTLGRARDERGRLLEPPARSWDAFFIATSVGVLTTGLIAYDLVAPALVALALMAWSLGRIELSGVLTGIALGSGIMPLVLVLALGVLCARAGRAADFGRWAAWAGGTLAVVLLLASTQSVSATKQAYLALLDPQVGYGSVWWLLKQMGITTEVMPGLSKLLVAAAMVGIALLALQAPRRPRVSQVAALMVLAGLLLAPTYSPQYVLWALGLVALARPQVRDWIVFTVCELVYFVAIWGHLQGNLRIGGEGDAEMGYPLAVMVHLFGFLWMGARIAHDMRQPEIDPVRLAPLVDDPQGGPLDWAPDADWMTTVKA